MGDTRYPLVARGLACHHTGRTVRPRRAVLTHLSHDMDYGILSGKLPENVMPAYDGLRLSLP